MGNVWLDRLYEPHPHARKPTTDPRWTPVALCLREALSVPGFGRIGSWNDRGSLQCAVAIRRWIGNAAQTEHVLLRGEVIHVVVRYGSDRVDAFGRYGQLSTLLHRLAKEHQCRPSDLSIRSARADSADTEWAFDRDLSKALAEHLHEKLGAHARYTDP